MTGAGVTAAHEPAIAAYDPAIAARRRVLQTALGLTWLLDAGLQLQPFMFKPVFATTILAPAVRSGPSWISAPGTWVAQLVAQHAAPFNAMFAITQLVIGAGLIWRHSVKAALAASIAWSLLVWWLGEGLGGILGEGASPLTGAPGAVILYALLALLAWPSERPGNSIAASSVLRTGAIGAWLMLWASEAYLALQPAASPGRSLHAAFTEAAAGEPAPLAAIDRWAAGIATHHGGEASTLFAALLALSAVAVLVRPRLARPILAITALLAAAIWVAGENFGAILTGQGTDPNSGLLLLLLVLAYWPWRLRAARITEREGPGPGRPAPAARSRRSCMPRRPPCPRPAR